MMQKHFIPFRVFRALFILLRCQASQLGISRVAHQFGYRETKLRLPAQIRCVNHFDCILYLGGLRASNCSAPNKRLLRPYVTQRSQDMYGSRPRSISFGAAEVTFFSIAATNSAPQPPHDAAVIDGIAMTMPGSSLCEGPCA